MTSQDPEKSGKAAFDMALNALGVWTKGAQAMTVEVVDYTRKSAESSVVAWEKLLGAKSLDSALAVQSEFARSARGIMRDETRRPGRASRAIGAPRRQGARALFHRSIIVLIAGL